MQYKHIFCAGHPRSGTHYITALISTNFLKDPDYLKIYGNHQTAAMPRDPEMAYIHIWRSFEGVAKSIFVLKDRFGLNVSDFETFLKTPYRQMWEEKKTDSVVTNVRTLSGRATYSGAVDFLRDVDMTPEAFWKSYVQGWMDAEKNEPNVLSIKYDDMMADFDGTMARVGKMLKSEVDRFQTINQKVGWWK